jgi:hypothetical protein
MFLPRRRQRRLLLPPGWVALGLLLLLGCFALLTHERQLQLINVLQLTLPSIKPSSSAPWNDFVYKRPAELNTLRPWHDAEFVGASLHDFMNAEDAEAAIRTINADSSCLGGVRIRFHQGATYGNLVDVLDIMNIENQKKYWLDFRHQPFTLYAITDKQSSVLKIKNSLYDDCMLCNDVFIHAPPGPTFQQLLFKKFVLLQQQVWRLPILLLVAISALSFYRLSRVRRAIR